MLAGKIIKLTWLGDHWRLNIDGMIRKFKDYHAMNIWLVDILDKVKDLGKKKLLLDDLNKFLIMGEH